MKKLLAVCVIVLFLGLAIAPSINANVSKEGELVEITTEVCGIDGVKPHTVKLTKEDAEEVEKLIDDIERRLDEVETREETVEIFNEAVVELDKYSLLGSLSIKQAQRLVTGGYQNSRVMEILGRMIGRNQNITNSNLLCLTAGHTTNSFIMGPLSLLGILLSVYLNWLFLIFFFFPVEICGLMVFGDFSIGQHAVYYPAEGWVRAIGLTGVKKWDGKFYGQLLKIDFGLGGEFLGGIGFTGFRMNYGFLNTFFLGSALLVKLGAIHP